MRAYCDSSILVKRVVLEPDSVDACDAMDAIVSAGGVCVTSTLARLEVGRAVLRRVPHISEQSLRELLSAAVDDTVEVDIAQVYLHAATYLRSQHLRSLDALHVATALLTECDVVLTRDRQMARACDELGLAVA